MTNKNLIFIQLNNGGVAEHSKLAFNNYLETQEQQKVSERREAPFGLCTECN